MLTGRRMGFFVLAVVLFAGLGGTALAATISIILGPDQNRGQGVSVTSGYDLTNVRYETDTETETDAESLVNQILFTLYRGTTGTGAPVGDETVVWARLLPEADWATCVAGQAGAVTCDLVNEGQQLAPRDTEGVEVVAYTK